MPDNWVVIAVAVPAVAAAGWYMLTRHKTKPVPFADPREEQLVRKLARVVGCSLAQALPAVRREVDIAPNQSDETLVKRAAYHYRQDLPETSCPVYQDKTRG